MLVGCLIVVVIGAMSTLSTWLPASAGQSVVLPSSIPDTCASGDSTAALENFLSSLPANTTVTFPEEGCFNIDSLWLSHTTGLTINANNSAFVHAAGPAHIVVPILFLTQNTNLTIENLRIYGGYDGTNGGVYYEGQYGIELEADHTVSLSDLSVNNVQGDFITLQAPNSGGITDGDQSLNTNISVTDSTFTNAGYHGVTLQSVNGAVFNHDTFTNMGPDAIDAEYDIYSSGINPDGSAYYAAQDNITISNDTWTNFSSDWYASLQGQLPGVQQQNVVLTGNTINAGSPLAEVVGTDGSQTPNANMNIGLTITNNTELWGAHPTRGGSITTPFAGSAMTFDNVAALNVSGNTMSMADGSCDPPNTYTYFCNTPYIAAMQVNGSYGLNIQNNNFTGALGVLHPSSGVNAYVTQCGNAYGVNAALVDAACAPTPHPGPPSCGPAFTSAATATAIVGTEFNYPVTTCGATEATIQASNLPLGLKLGNTGNGTAVISGTPSIRDEGHMTISTLTANDKATILAKQSLAITVDGAPVFRGPSHYGASENAVFHAVIATTAYPTAALSTTSPLPTGLTLTDNGNGTAKLCGILGAKSSGTYPIVVVADNGVGSPTTHTVTLTVMSAR